MLLEETEPVTFGFRGSWMVSQELNPDLQGNTASLSLSKVEHKKTLSTEGPSSLLDGSSPSLMVSISLPHLGAIGRMD